jgi:hypothetical protein
MAMAARDGNAARLIGRETDVYSKPVTTPTENTELRLNMQAKKRRENLAQREWFQSIMQREAGKGSPPA